MRKVWLTKNNKKVAQEVKKLRRAYRVTPPNYKNSIANRIMNKTKLLHYTLKT